MNDQHAIATADQPATSGVDPAQHVLVVARNQEEMQLAQGNLVRWFEGKGASIETELAEARANLETAKASADGAPTRGGGS